MVLGELALQLPAPLHSELLRSGVDDVAPRAGGVDGNTISNIIVEGSNVAPRAGGVD